MAQLKSSVVQGSLRVTDTTYTTDLNLASADINLAILTDENKNLVTGIVPVSAGGTGNTSLTQDRLIYSNTATQLSSTTITSDGTYLGAISYLSVNQNHQTDYRLYVNGVSYFTNSLITDPGEDNGILKTIYSDTTYNTIRNHNNGNISISAASGGLYVGYENTPVTHIYYSNDTSSRTEFFQINSDGSYALTRFGVNGQNTSYNLYVNGNSYLDSTTASSTTNLSSQLIVSNSNSGNVAIELWRNSNASWQIANEGGTLFMRNNWTTAKQATYSQSSIAIDYNTGNTAIAGSLAVGQITRNTSYKLYVNGASYFSNTITGDILSAWHILGGHPTNTTNFNTYFETTTNLHHDNPARTDAEITYNRFFLNHSDQTTYGPSALYLPVVDQHVLSFGIDNGTVYSRHIAFDVRTNAVYVRARTNSTWGNWEQLVRNTGTWGISITGNAATATKLGTATVGALNRPIYLNAGSPAAVSWYMSSCSISGGNTANFPWHRFATCTTGTGTYVDRSVIVVFHARFNNGKYGIIKLSVRTNGSGVAMNSSAQWILRQGFAADDVKITSGGTTGTDTRFNAWVKCGTYPRMIAYILEGSNNGWSLISSYEPNDCTAASSGTEINASVSGNNGVDGGTIVNYANSSGSASALKDAANNTSITAQYSGAGESATDWFAEWGNYKLIAVSSTNVANKIRDKASGTWGISITGNAATATKATQDGSGNTITSTYLKLTGGTMTGGLTINRTNSAEAQVIVQSTAGTIYMYSQNSATGNRGLYGKNNAGTNASYLYIQQDNYVRAGTRIYGAVWNDYAEFRLGQMNDLKPGQIVTENGNGTMRLANKRLEKGCKVISDTYGFALGETNSYKLPIAVSGRVLVYCDTPPEELEPGDCLCSNITGNAIKMTQTEIINYPDRIIGTVSEIPTYDIWHGGDLANDKGIKEDIIVNGRIWIYVR